MAVSKLEFNKIYYEIGYSTKNNNPNHAELKKKYEGLQLLYAVIGKVKANDFDAIIQHKGKNHESFIAYSSDDFDTTMGVKEIKPSYVLFESIEDAMAECDRINNSVCKHIKSTT